MTHANRKMESTPQGYTDEGTFPPESLGECSTVWAIKLLWTCLDSDSGDEGKPQGFRCR